MSDELGYLIDSDVFITAKNFYYAFPICPGFWDSLLHSHSVGRLHSIDRIKHELLNGNPNEDLVLWVKNSVPDSFFIGSNGEDIINAFSQIMLWVTRHPQYQDHAKAKFASGADGWLVAHGIVSGKVIVTNEQPRPEARNQIKLPDVCNAFDVQYEDTFSMLRRIGAQYHFQ